MMCSYFFPFERWRFEFCSGCNPDHIILVLMSILSRKLNLREFNMPVFQMTQTLFSNLKRLVGFILGGSWLLVLYVYTGWMVVGSLGSIQLHDDLELEQPGATFHDVERARLDFKKKEGALRGRFAKETEQLNAGYELQNQYDDVWEQISITAPKLGLVTENDSIYDDYVSYRIKILDKCSDLYEVEPTGLTKLCDKFTLVEDLGYKMDAAFAKAGNDGNNETDDDSESSDIKLERQLAELRQNTPFTDLFGTAVFMKELGYGMFLNAPRYLLVLQLTMIMGMLGSVVTMTWSFVRGDNGVTVRRFLFLPFVGSISAIIIFVFLKAGQLTISSGGGTASLGPFFLSFVGIVSGLLSERAYARMETVGKNFFSVETEELRWGVRLKEAMTQAGISLTDLALYLAVDEDRVENIVEEKLAATLYQQQLIAACLRRNTRELFTDVPPVSNKPTATEQITVPVLAGKDISLCKQTLEGLALTLNDPKQAASDDVLAGKVIDQQPIAGELVARNSAIDITISSGPAK
jgi:hypothetical protein